MIKIGDYVTRKKYKNDIIFKIINRKGNIAYLKGINIRLCADAKFEDLVLTTIPRNEEKIEKLNIIDKNKYFNIPGKILHIDSDEDYLIKCMEYYNEQRVLVKAKIIKEKDLENKLMHEVSQFKPDILVITGHDAHYKNVKNGLKYKNSKYFIEAVKKVKLECNSNNQIIVIAGACQSDFEGLINAGAIFASSPKRVNIHAIDPAIVATYISLSPNYEKVDLVKIINSTHYKGDGIGGIIVNGKLKRGYPRKE